MTKKPALLFMSLAVFAGSISAQSNAAMRAKVFEKIWGTVNEKFYDPSFNGVDWRGAHDQYLPVAVRAKDDEEFYKTVTEMLSLLKVSHLQAGSAASVAKRFKTQPGVTGIGLRNVEGRITVYRSLPDFPSAKAGIRPGFVITEVDGVRPVNVEAASKGIAGAPDTTVRAKYLDENDNEHEVSLKRQGLTDKGKIAGLNIYTLFDSKRLEGGIGYISFSSFVPSINAQIAAAFDSMRNAPGIIIDLRGNSGGDDSVALKIEERLFDKPTQLMLVKTRKGVIRDMRVGGTSSAYKGRIVILVDEFSGSASEDLAAGLQEAGRAYVIGKRTKGEDLDADVEELPDGGLLIYPFGLTTTPKGVVIEGRGVVPDLDVELKRADLLNGHDTQLEAAISYLLKK